MLLAVFALGAGFAAAQVREINCGTTFDDLTLALVGQEALVRCPEECAATGADTLYGCAPTFSEGPVCSGAALQLFGEAYMRLRRSFTVRKVATSSEMEGCNAGGVVSTTDTSPAQRYDIVAIDRGTVLACGDRMNETALATEESVGASHAFVCPGSCEDQTSLVEGCSTYSDRSAVCAAAAHDFGGFGSAGAFLATTRAGLSSYGGQCERNGVSPQEGIRSPMAFTMDNAWSLPAMVPSVQTAAATGDAADTHVTVRARMPSSGAAVTHMQIEAEPLCFRDDFDSTTANLLDHHWVWHAPACQTNSEATSSRCFYSVSRTSGSLTIKAGPGLNVNHNDNINNRRGNAPMLKRPEAFEHWHDWSVEVFVDPVRGNDAGRVISNSYNGIIILGADQGDQPMLGCFLATWRGRVLRECKLLSGRTGPIASTAAPPNRRGWIRIHYSAAAQRFSFQSKEALNDDWTQFGFLNADGGWNGGRIRRYRPALFVRNWNGGTMSSTNTFYTRFDHFRVNVAGGCGAEGASNTLSHLLPVPAGSQPGDLLEFDVTAPQRVPHTYRVAAVGAVGVAGPLSEISTPGTAPSPVVNFPLNAAARSSRGLRFWWDFSRYRGRLTDGIGAPGIRRIQSEHQGIHAYQNDANMRPKLRTGLLGPSSGIVTNGARQFLISNSADGNSITWAQATFFVVARFKNPGAWTWIMSKGNGAGAGDQAYGMILGAGQHYAFRFSGRRAAQYGLTSNDGTIRQTNFANNYMTALIEYRVTYAFCYHCRGMYMRFNERAASIADGFGASQVYPGGPRNSFKSNQLISGPFDSRGRYINVQANNQDPLRFLANEGGSASAQGEVMEFFKFKSGNGAIWGADYNAIKSYFDQKYGRPFRCSTVELMLASNSSSHQPWSQCPSNANPEGGFVCPMGCLNSAHSVVAGSARFRCEYGGWQGSFPLCGPTCPALSRGESNAAQCTEDLWHDDFVQHFRQGSTSPAAIAARGAASFEGYRVLPHMTDDFRRQLATLGTDANETEPHHREFLQLNGALRVSHHGLMELAEDIILSPESPKYLGRIVGTESVLVQAEMRVVSGRGGVVWHLQDGGGELMPSGMNQNYYRFTISSAARAGLAVHSIARVSKPTGRDRYQTVRVLESTTGVLDNPAGWHKVSVKLTYGLPEAGGPGSVRMEAYVDGMHVLTADEGPAANPLPSTASTGVAASKGDVRVRSFTVSRDCPDGGIINDADRGQRVRMGCAPGFSGVGSDTRTCNIHGEWTGEDFYCRTDPPSFGNSTRFVDEHSPVGTPVGEPLVARSPLPVTFELFEPGNDNAFRIDPCTGQIYVRNDVLDYERTASYRLRVLAKADNDDNAVAESYITVQLNNINDPPRFAGRQMLTIEENAPPGTLTDQAVVATDDENSPLLFNVSVVGGFGQDAALGPLFDMQRVNDSAARLRVAREDALGLLDFESREIVQLIVRAYDAGDHSLFSDGLVTLQITDGADPPRILPSQFITIDEDTATAGPFPLLLPTAVQVYDEDAQSAGGSQGSDTNDTMAGNGGQTVGSVRLFFDRGNAASSTFGGLFTDGTTALRGPAVLGLNSTSYQLHLTQALTISSNDEVLVRDESTETTYIARAAYNVQLRARDGDGLESTPRNVTVLVTVNTTGVGGASVDRIEANGPEGRVATDGSSQIIIGGVGLDGISGPITVSYGPYVATGCGIVREAQDVGEDIVSIQCQSVPGHGRDHRVTIMAEGRELRAPSLLLLSYQPPALDGVSGTRANDTLGETGLDVQRLLTVGNQIMYLRGTGFANNISAVRVQYGPRNPAWIDPITVTDPPEVFNPLDQDQNPRYLYTTLRATVVGVSNTEVAIRTAPGLGTEFGWKVEVDGQIAFGSEQTEVGYGVASVTSISPTSNLATSRFGIPTRGSAGVPSRRLQVQGHNFGPSAWLGSAVDVRIRYGPTPDGRLYETTCSKPSPSGNQPHTQLSCPVAEGVGTNLTVAVGVNGRWSIPEMGNDLLVRGTPVPDDGSVTPPPPLQPQDLESALADAVATVEAVSGVTVEAAQIGYRPPSLTAVEGESIQEAVTPGGQIFRVLGSDFGPADTSGQSVDWVRYGGGGLSMGSDYAAGGSLVGMGGTERGDGGFLNDALQSMGWFAAQDCEVRSHEELRCQTSAGTGRDHALAVSVGGQSSTVLGEPVISYQPPSVAGFDGPGAEDAATVGSEQVVVRGRNLGPASRFSDISRFFYEAEISTDGQGGGTRRTILFEAQGCSMASGADEHIRVVCTTAPGAGEALEWILSVDGQNSSFPVTSYQQPSITGVGTVADLSAINDAPTDGGTRVRIQGTNFGPGSLPFILQRVVYGTREALVREFAGGASGSAGSGSSTFPGYVYEATDVELVSHTEIRATMVPGVGRDLVFVVTVADQSSLPSEVGVASVSYARPSVEELSPASWFPDTFTDPTTVTVIGRDFGLLHAASDVAVAFGNPADYSSEGGLIQPRSSRVLVDGRHQVTFDLPASHGLDRAVRIAAYPRGVSLDRASEVAVFSDPITDGSASLFDYYDPRLDYLALNSPLRPEELSFIANTSSLSCPDPSGLNAYCGLRVLTLYGRNFGTFEPPIAPSIFLTFRDFPTISMPEQNQLVVLRWADDEIVLLTKAAEGGVQVQVNSLQYADPSGSGPGPAPQAQQSARLIFQSVAPDISELNAPAEVPTIGGEDITMDVENLNVGQRVAVLVGRAGREKVCRLYSTDGNTLFNSEADGGVDDPATAALATTTAQVTIRCRLPEGEGAAVPVTVQTWTGTDWKRSRVGGSIQYSPPSILRAELLGGPASGQGTGGVAADGSRPMATESGVAGAGLPTVGGVLRVVGDNFGLCPTILFGAHDPIRMCDGNGLPYSAPTLLTQPGILARSHNFVEVRLPAGHGASLRVDVDVAGQLPSTSGAGARFLRASYDAASISEVIPKTAGTGLPTSGGSRVRIIGSNFGAEDGSGGYPGGPLVVLEDGGSGGSPGSGNITAVNGSDTSGGSGPGSPAIRAPDGGPLFRDRTVEMRSLAGTGASWISCGAVLRVSHEEMECVLPEGMGRVIDVRVTVGNAAPVVTPGAASYDPPVVSSMEVYQPIAGLSAEQMGRDGLLSAGAPESSAAPGSIPLYGNTTGGYAVRLQGTNFGRPFGAAAGPGSLCVFLAHAYRTRPDRMPMCDNRESFLGEGEVSAASILHWWHDEIMFVVPIGAGTREIRLFIAGNLLAADRAVLPNDTTTLPAGVAPMPGFSYRAPWIEMGGIRPDSGSTDGGDLVTIFAYNLPPPPLEGLEAESAAEALSSGSGVSLAVAPYLPVAWLRIDFWKDCITNARTVDGLFPNDPRVASCYPRRDSRIDIRQQDMESIVFDSAPGIGRERQVRLTIVENNNGPNTTSTNFAEWNYNPPQIDGADPSGLAVTGELVDDVELVARMQDQYGARFLGRNFGADEDADRQGWTAEERRLVLRIDGEECLPNTTIRARETIRRGDGAVGFRPTVSCIIPELPVGYKTIEVEAAGQNGTSEDILLFACDRGFFGDASELCLPCPRGADCNGHLRLVPQLHQDLIDQRALEITQLREAILQLQEDFEAEQNGGRRAQTDAEGEGGGAGAGEEQEEEDGLRSPESARSLGASLADPRYLTVDVDEDDGPWQMKYTNVLFHEPRPQTGWYNLNETEQLAQCPGLFRVQDRPQCVVPCDPVWACTGDNFCATGYRSVGPEWRCNACDEGYYRRAGECVECPDNPWILIAVFLILMICGVGFVYFLAKYNINLVLTTLGMDYFQVLALFTQSRVPWPPVLEDILHILSAFNLNIEITAPECTVPDLSYMSKWMFIMMLPVAGLVCLSLVYLGVSVYEHCIKGKTRTEAWYGQHLNRCISMFLVGGYILYLILSRTSFDVLNCQPTTPPDGNLYLQVVFEPCSKPDGIHRTLLGPAIVTLMLYGLGFPAIVFYVLYTNHDLIMEDQLLRAMRQGEDTVTNPNAYTVRRRFSKMYFAFKPIGYRIYWMLALVARKFFFALTSLLFVRNPVMQLSMSLLVMFAAFAAQTRFHPFMSPDEMEDTLRQHKRLSFDINSPHAKLAASIKSVVSKGRKTATYGQGFGRLTESPNLLVQFGGTVMGAAINYNTIESVLLGSAVLVNLAGIMFSSGQLNTDETGDYYAGYRDTLIALTLLVIFGTLIYFFAVFTYDIYTLCVSAQEGEREKGKGGKKGGRRGSSMVRGGAGASTKAGGFEDGLPDEEEQMVGVISQQTNPVFARASQRNLLADSLDAEEAMDDLKTPPDSQQWAIFRDQYRTLQQQVRSLTDQAKEARQTADKAELEQQSRPKSSTEAAAVAAGGLQRNPMGRRGQRRTRKSVFAPTSSQAGPAGEAGAKPGASAAAGFSGGDGAASLAALRKGARGRGGSRG